MAEDTISWHCENEDCGAENLVDRELIQRAIDKKKNVTLICGNCGFVNKPSKIVEEEQKTWLACIPFTGSERILPTGHTPAGYTDYKGVAHSRTEFIKKYQIDPKTYLEWRKRGRPKAED